VASVSAYRKQLSGFFASVRTDATEALLNEYFLPLDYLNYDIVTQTNIDSSVRIDGLEEAGSEAERARSSSRAESLRGLERQRLRWESQKLTQRLHGATHRPS